MIEITIPYKKILSVNKEITMSMVESPYPKHNDLLVGVKVTSSTKSSYKFICHITGKVVTKKSGRSHIKKLDMTITSYIMDLNKILSLPNCKVCGETVKIRGNGSKISLLHPVVSETCSNSKCGKSLGGLRSSETAKENGNHVWSNMTKEELSEKGKRSAKTALSRGTHRSQNMSSEDKKIQSEKMIKTMGKDGLKSRGLAIRDTRLSDIVNGENNYTRSGRKSATTQLSNGNHPSQVGSHHIYDGDTHFSSKAELNVFTKYRRLLSKYYYRESKVSEYDGKIYIADYVKKNNSSSNIPDVIEVKGSGGNFNIGYKGRDDTTKNYAKFKSVIDQNMTLMIISSWTSGKSIRYKKYLIKSLDDLNELFGRWV